MVINHSQKGTTMLQKVLFFSLCALCDFISSLSQATKKGSSLQRQVKETNAACSRCFLNNDFIVTAIHKCVNFCFAFTGSLSSLKTNERRRNRNPAILGRIDFFAQLVLTPATFMIDSPFSNHQRAAFSASSPFFAGRKFTLVLIGNAVRH